MPGKRIIRKYYQSLPAAADSVVWAPETGKRWVLTDVVISSSSANSVTLEDALSTGDASLLSVVLAANGGMVSNFQTPLQSAAEDTNLTVTTTSTSLLRIMLSGEEI